MVNKKKWTIPQLKLVLTTIFAKFEPGSLGNKQRKWLENSWGEGKLHRTPCEPKNST
jgi:hypothetical protein